MLLIYIAGRYRAKTQEGIRLNIESAKHMARLVIEKGHYPVCPHSNTDGFEHLCDATDQFYLDATLELMRRCDAVLMVPGWRESEGARGEHAEAIAKNIRIFYSIEDLVDSSLMKAYAIKGIKVDAGGFIYGYGVNEA